MAKTTVRVDTKELDKKMKKVLNVVRKTANKSVDDVALVGKKFSKMIAPHFSNRTANLIKIQHKLTNEGKVDTIIAKNIIQDGHKRKFGRFDLVRWMHAKNGILRGRKHIKSGDPRFMLTTRDTLNRVKGQVARGNFQTIRIR